MAQSRHGEGDRLGPLLTRADMALQETDFG
jgi:hypothetical protein